MEHPCVTRRAVLAGGCAAAAATALSACAGYGAGGPVTGSAPSAVPNEAAGTAGGTAAGPRELAAVADVPVGGGVVLADRGLVVTQPVAGTFKGFGATCTHQGCTVTEVKGGTINCPCHGSRFAVADGAPTAGPATTPLPERPVTVEGTSVVLA